MSQSANKRKGGFIDYGERFCRKEMKTLKLFFLIVPSLFFAPGQVVPASSDQELQDILLVFESFTAPMFFPYFLILVMIEFPLLIVFFRRRRRAPWSI